MKNRRQSSAAGRSLSVVGPEHSMLCLLFALLCLLFVGCSQARVRFSPKSSGQEMLREVEQLSEAGLSQPVSVGSLWPADDHVFFYADKKALREGDILTISIVETATATNSADTDLSRSSSITARANSILGAKGRFLGSLLGTNLLDATSENAHVGSGTTSRTGKLTASMTVVVQRVLANGNLVVQGSRDVVVNHEEQFMTLTGIVRPEDINRNNVVLSTHVANARITIGGIGVVDDKQKSGWGIWIFDWLWPF